MKTRFYLIILLSLVMTVGCKDGPQLKSNVGGKAGELVVVFDQQLWDTSFTKQVKKIIVPDYQILPQREPVFDLTTIPSSAFSTVFQLHRNILLVQVTPDSIESRITVKHDIWAQPQTVIRLNGANREDILTLMVQEQERLLNILEHAEHDRVINNTKKYEDRAIRDTLTKIFGGSPYIPAGYVLRKTTPEFAWIGYETAKSILGIFVYKYPYKDSTSFRLNNIIAARNTMLEKEVPGQFNNTYMTTTNIEPPIARSLLYNKIHFVEVRGLWDIKNDFMGGPFISHSFLDQSGKNIICLEAFVYNPRSDKRNYLRQLEAMLYSFEWAENQ